MNFTFGIVTNNGDLTYPLLSIRQLNIPNYEIIIVGNPSKYTLDKHTTIISFDETIKEGWITKKKNMICEKAKYDNIVLMHDYIFIHPDFYTGFLKFGENYNICVTKILNADNTRYRDYILFPQYPWWNKVTDWKCQKFLLPYWLPNNHKLNKFIYVSGSFYVIKKDIALKYPLDENLVWGTDEDVQLSINLTNDDILIKCNQYSTVQFMKYKVRAYCMDQDILNIHDVKNLLTALDNLEKNDPDFFKIKYNSKTKQKLLTTN